MYCGGRSFLLAPVWILIMLSFHLGVSLQIFFNIPLLITLCNWFIRGLLYSSALPLISEKSAVAHPVKHANIWKYFLLSRSLCCSRRNNLPTFGAVFLLFSHIFPWSPCFFVFFFPLTLRNENFLKRSFCCLSGHFLWLPMFFDVFPQRGKGETTIHKLFGSRYLPSCIMSWTTLPVVP